MSERNDFNPAMIVVEALGGDFSVLDHAVIRKINQKVGEIRDLIGVKRDPLALRTWKAFSELPASTPFDYLISWQDHQEDVPSWSSHMFQVASGESEKIVRILHLIHRVHSPQTIGDFASLTDLNLKKKDRISNRGLGYDSIVFYRTAFQGEGIED